MANVKKDLVQTLGSDIGVGGIGGSNPTPKATATTPTTTSQGVGAKSIPKDSTDITRVLGDVNSDTGSISAIKDTIIDKRVTDNSSNTTSETATATTTTATTTTGPSTEAKAENSAYYDMLDAKNTKPEYQQSSDTSSGATAAEGTQYSWDKKGTDQAQNQYQQDVLKAKQDALANRQTIEQNALQYQQQSDMMKYSNNQNAEKVGWTGGYVLDQNRQMEYLKSSIQAQMYGAMELQKYGYDSALAAARLSYDMNQKEFAHKYYQDAVNVAISEAQITGTYFSAETRDMMTQYNASDQELGDLKDKTIEEIDEGIANGTITLTPEQSRAYEVKKNIKSWYEANDVSETGIKTLAAWQAETAMAQDWANTQWEMYQAANDAANNKISEDANAFIMTDADGKPMYDGTEVKVGNWKTMSGEDIINYLSNEDGTINSEKQQQFFSYIDTQLGGQVSSGFAEYCNTNEIDPKNYDKAMVKYLTSSDYIGKFLNNKFQNVSKEQATALFNNINGYSIDIALPDGTEHTYTLEVSTKNSLGSTENTSNNTTNDKDEKPSIAGDGKLPEEPIIKDTYTNGEDLIEDLTDNPEFKDLNVLISNIDWSKDPTTWFDDFNSTGGQWAKFGLHLAGPIGALVTHIQDATKAKDYKAFGESLQQTKDSIITQLGEDNYKLLQETYTNYEKMDSRTKALLSKEQKEYYEKVSSFINGINQLDDTIAKCKQNDSDIWSNGWNYVGDTWSKIGTEWSEVDNLGDVVVAVGSTVSAVATSVFGGITGFVRWAFTGKGANQ